LNVRQTRQLQLALTQIFGPAGFASLLAEGRLSSLTSSFMDAIIRLIPVSADVLILTSRTVTELFQRTFLTPLQPYRLIVIPYLYSHTWNLLVIDIINHSVTHYDPVNNNQRIPQIRLLLQGLSFQLAHDAPLNFTILKLDCLLPCRPHQSGCLVLYYVYCALHNWSPVISSTTYPNFKSQLIWSLYTNSLAAHASTTTDTSTALRSSRFQCRLFGPNVGLLCSTPPSSSPDSYNTAFSNFLSQHSSIPPSTPSLTPVFPPDPQCQLFHHPHRRCPTCGLKTPDLPKPSHRSLLQSYDSYCEMLSAQHTDDPNRYVLIQSDLCVATININTLTSNKTLYLA